jgi:membrane-associated phospholipid phosphatase
MPQRVWRLWLLILLIGAGLLALLSLIAVWIVRPRVEAGPLQAWDAAGVLWVAEVTPIDFPKAMFIGSMGDIIVLLPVVLLTVVIAIYRQAPLTAATQLAGYSLVTGLLWVGWSAWNRARPDLIADGVAATGLHAFPSGHMLVSIPVYGFLCYLWCSQTASWTERAVAILLTALLLVGMGWSRLVVGVHWPTDIIAGTLLGLVWLGVQIVALRRAATASAQA